MDTLFVLVGSALIVYLLVQVSHLSRRILDLEKRLAPPTTAQSPGIASPLSRPAVALPPGIPPPIAQVYPPPPVFQPSPPPPVQAFTDQPPPLAGPHIPRADEAAPRLQVTPEQLAEFEGYRQRNREASTRNWADLESLIGANWPAKLGIAAIVLAVSFFLQYAFKSGLIGPAVRIAGGIAASAVMLGAGQILIRRPRYAKFAQILSSGGMICFFVSIYAAYNLYRLIGYGPALAVLILAAVASSYLAIRNDTEAVAALCIAGAFAAPALIRQGGGAASLDGMVRLYSYIALLNIWVFVLMGLRRWSSLTVVSLAATWILFFASPHLTSAAWARETFATLFLAMACMVGIRLAGARPEGQETDPRGFGLGVIVAACAVYLVASGVCLADELLFGLPAFVISGVVAVVTISAALVFAPSLSGYAAANRPLGFLPAAALGAVLVVLLLLRSDMPAPRSAAVPAFLFCLFNYLLFLGTAWVMSRKEGGDNAASALAAASAVMHAMMVWQALDGVALLGLTAASLWLPVAGCIALGAAASIQRGAGAKSGLLAATLTVAAQAMTVLALFASLPDKGSPVNFALGVLLAEFCAVSTVWLALRRAVGSLPAQPGRTAIFVNAAAYFGMMTWTAGSQTMHGISVIAICAVVMALLHLAAGLFLKPEAGNDRLVRALYMGLALTFATIAIPLQLKANAITVAWAVEAAVLVRIGLGQSVRWLPRYGLCLLALVVAKALLIDIFDAPASFHFLANSRMLAGGSVIAALYASAWFIAKAKPNEPIAPSVLSGVMVAAANLLTLCYVSVDLWTFVGRSAAGQASDNPQQLALSLFWATYALALACIGFWRRSRAIRLLGMGLLYISIVKVFLFDLSGLQQPYRIVSFLVLGIVLLLVSLLYTSFESRIKESAEPALPETGNIAVEEPA